MFGRATIRLGIGPHSSLILLKQWWRIDGYVALLIISLSVFILLIN